MRFRTLAVLAASTALFAAAGPATAADNTPVDANGKKSCKIDTEGGGYRWYDHGTVLTVSGNGGGVNGNVSLKCDDGEWKTNATRTRAVAPLVTQTVKTVELGVVTLQIRGTIG